MQAFYDIAGVLWPLIPAVGFTTLGVCAASDGERENSKVLLKAACWLYFLGGAFYMLAAIKVFF